MPKNEGTLDRVFRVLVGLGVLSLAFIGPKSPLGYIGIIPFVTGAVGYCPFYALMGISSCSLKKE
jgi:hypothetical protein